METEQLSENQNSISLRKIAIICCSYFIALILLVFVTLIFDISLSVGESFFASLSPWGTLLLFAYFGAPLVIAFIAGVFYRPFLRNFIILLATIFLVHLAYDGMALGLKSLYLQSKIGSGVIKIVSLSHKVIDTNNDGKNDQIVLGGELDTTALPVGDYIISPTLSQELQTQNANERQFLFLFGPRFRGYEFSITAPKKQQHFEIFFVDSETPGGAENFKGIKERGEVTVDLELRKKIVFDTAGKFIVISCNWTIFFCKNSWEGYDPLLYEAPIQQMKKAYVFSLK